MPLTMLHEILKNKILAAVTFENSADALPVAEAFMRAGLYVMEVAFRTKDAAKAIEVIRKNYPEMHVGAGTLLSTEQLHKAIDAGAAFGLSPGFNKTVLGEARRNNFAFIPGVMTPSEIEKACELGYDILKLFPAEQIGGVSFVKAMLAPYEQLQVQFIPMGGVNINNMRHYTTMKNVIAVGGSWLATKELIAARQYQHIHDNVVAALQVVDRRDA